VSVRSKAPTSRATSHPRTSTKRPAARSQTVVKRARSLPTPRAEQSRSLTQAAATRNFLSICREAIRHEARVYVKDRAGQFYLTLDPKKRHLGDPIIEVRAQLFKDNFSRFSSLIKDGLCFRLSHRGSKAVIYARRHTGYSDPLDHLIEQWRERVAEASSTKRQEEKLLLAIKALDIRGDGHSEDVLRELRRLAHGIARLAIGYRPFEEGQLPENGYRMIDEGQPQ